MREELKHKSNPVITILPDEPDPRYGNASHVYACVWSDSKSESHVQNVMFQRGPLRENPTNGITEEILLAILIDRIETFQCGQFACEENAQALSDLKSARDALELRTERRIGRGVEGRNIA